MKAFLVKSMIFIIFGVLTGCSRPLVLPPNADPIYCHLNADFVRQGYYPPPTSLPPNTPVLGNTGSPNVPSTYTFPRNRGTGPHLAPH